MAIRRQGFEWQVKDLGQLPPKRLADLSNSPQSVFISGIGNATITKRNRTANDEFLVLQYVGSTPGIWPNSGTNWVPRGYINFVVETTTYFVNPDGLPAEGLPGTAMPYPVSIAFSPSFTDYIPIHIPPDTNWDITYFLGNAIVTPTEEFPVPAIDSWTSSGITPAPAPVYSGSPYTLDQGTAYVLTPTNTGGAATGWAVTSGTLPAGLSINAGSGVISGTPTTAGGPTTVTVTATGASGSGSTNVTFTVVTNPPVFAYTGSPYTFTRGVAITPIGPTVTGGATPTGYSVLPALPTGLSINASTGQISGTPTAITASSTYTVTATSAGGSGTTGVDIEIVGNPPVIVYAGAPFSFLTDEVVSESPTNTGGSSTSWAVTAGTLPTGLSLNATTGDITGTCQAVYATASVTITATNADGSGATSPDFTVDAGVPSIVYIGTPYNETENVAIGAGSIVPTATFSPITSYAETGALPAGVTLSPVTGEVSGTPAIGSAGTYNLIVEATGPGGTSPPAPLDISVAPAAPIITYAGSPYSNSSGLPFGPVFPTNTGGAATSWAVTAGALPTGVSLNAGDGSLSGVTLDPPGSTANFTVTATNGTGSSAAAVTINTTV
jgi:hypothetical protein